MARRLGKDLLTPDDWARAALEAIAEGGVAGVAVDRLARRLGASRGSFYWHFTDRGALVDAALERWERENTTDLIPEAEAIPEPVERLREVFRTIYEHPVDPIELTLAAERDDPAVAPVFARATRARIAFLRRIFAQLGLPDADADDRAWLAYAFYLGHHQLASATGTRELAPADLDRLVDLLTAPARAP